MPDELRAKFKTLPGSVSSSAAAPAQPAAEQAVARMLASYIEKYKAAANDLQKSSLRSGRAAELGKLLPNRTATGWTGTVKKLKTTGEGKAILEIQLEGSKAIVSNYDFGQSHLMEQSSPLYARAATTVVGDKVTFSATFPADPRDFIKETSLSESGSMTEPEFLVTFTNLAKAAR